MSEFSPLHVDAAANIPDIPDASALRGHSILSNDCSERRRPMAESTGCDARYLATIAFRQATDAHTRCFRTSKFPKASQLRLQRIQVLHTLWQSTVLHA